MSRHERFFILMLLVFTFDLRIIGIAWGQPNPTYSPSYAPRGMIHEQTPLQPDEFLFAALPFKMALTGNLNPKFFETPSFLLNTSFLLTKLTGADSGYRHEDRVGLNDRYYAPFTVYVVNRVLSALGGLLAVACSYALARYFGGRYAALLTGLLVAVSMPLVQHAHYGTTSSLAIGFMMLTLVAGARSLTGTPRQALWWLALCGVSAGLATGNRYNVAFVSLVTLVCGAMLAFRHRSWRVWLGVVIGRVLFPATFLLTTPGAIYDTPKFIEDLRYISNQYIGSGVNQFVVSPWLGLLHELAYTLVIGLGGAGGLLAFGGMLVGWRGKDFNRRLLFALMLAVLFLHVFLINRTVRPSGADQLTLPLIPLLCVCAGIGYAFLAKHLSFWLRVLVVVGCVALSLVPTLHFLKQVTVKDTRYQTQAWIYATMPRQSSVLLVGSINVPLDPRDYRWTQIFDRPANVDWAAQPAYDYLLISEGLPNRFRKMGIESPDNLPEGARLLWQIEANSLNAVAFPVYTVDYYHNPTLRLFCLNEGACDATIP
jgi:hypothetical protein